MDILILLYWSWWSWFLVTPCYFVSHGGILPLDTTGFCFAAKSCVDYFPPDKRDVQGDEQLTVEEPFIGSHGYHLLSTLRPKQNGHHFAADIFRFIVFLKIVYFCHYFTAIYWWESLTICQHWFRWWLGAEQVPSDYLNEWWSISLTHLWITQP